MTLTPTAEVFVSIASGDDLPDSGTGYGWVGDAPRLSTRDGSTTYGHTTHEVTVGTMIGFRTAGTVGDTVRLEAQVRYGGYVGDIIIGAYVTDDILDVTVFGESNAAPSDGTGWVDLSWDIPVDPSTRAALNAAPYTRVLLWSGVLVETSLIFGDTFDVSYLKILGGAHPHQIFQRGDSLGAGGSLVFGPSTRQGSGLVFGTH
jgi:hypothetical protein